MFKMEHMKTLVEERLTAAVEDVLGIIDNVIKYYEEKDSRSKSEISRQNSLLDVLLKPKTTLQRAVCKEEVPPEQQERSPSLDQEDPELFQIKEEEQEPWTRREGEQLQYREETDSKHSIYTVACMRSLYDQHQSQFPHPNQTVEDREGEPLSSTSNEHMRTEAYGEGCGYSEPTSDCQLLSSDCSVAESEDPDRDEDRMYEGPQSGLETMESSLLSQDALNCRVCGKSFTYYAIFMKHVKTHAQDAPCVCGVCGEHVESTQSLVDHLKSHKTREICRIHHNGFHSSRYKAVHAGLKPHGCVDCGKRFTSNYDLSMHMQIHTGEKPYGCCVCGKGFGSASDLKQHTKTHTGEKPYSCGYCGRTFRHQHHIQRHVKIHTGEKPYSCSVCGKGFITASDLKMHMMTHTGERPYSCSVCGKGFVRSADLQRHMKIHTGEKPYSCSICGKGFSRRDKGQNHMKTHTGERP